jgi:hypothetical protein
MYYRKLTRTQKIILGLSKRLASKKLHKNIKAYVLSPNSRPWSKWLRHPGLINPLTYWRYKVSCVYGIPLKQVNAFFALSRLEVFHKKIGAISIPIKGTLLGAIRSNSFAGRPGDLDFFIIIEGGVDEYYDNLKEVGQGFGLKSGAHKWHNGKLAKLKIITDLPIDVVVCDHSPTQPGSLVEDNNPKPIFGVIEWPGVEWAEKTNVHSLEFYLPKNHVELLEAEYGFSWAIPKGIQWHLGEE